MEQDCIKYKDLLLELEKLRGEMASLNMRVMVYEGNLNSNVSRLHIRLDSFAKDVKVLQDQQIRNNAKQQQDIDTLKLHARYITGLAAGVVFLLSFAKRIKDFFVP